MLFPRRPRSLSLLFIMLLALIGTAPGAEARDLRVGAFVNSLSAIDPANGTYNISAYLWFIDPAGDFDPREDLYVLARSTSINEYYEERGPMAGPYVSIRLDAVVDQEFDLTQFPFDEQRLLLRIEAGETIDVIRLVPDTEAPQIADYVHLADWRLGAVALGAAEHSYTVRYGLGAAGPRTFSQVELTIDAARVQTSVVVDDFLGFIFSFIITCLIYFVPTSELATRVGMTTGSLFAALLNLNRLLDTAGFKAEFGLVEQLGFLIFAAILVSLIVSILMKRLSVRRGVEAADRIDGVLGTLIAIAFLVAILLVLRAGID